MKTSEDKIGMTDTTVTRPPATAPTVDDVREGLRATLTPVVFERVWAEVCAQISVPTTVSSLPDSELDALLDQIATQDRLCKVLAMSWRIRCTAARKLHQLGR